MPEEPPAAPEELRAPGTHQGTAQPQFPSLYPNGAAVFLRNRGQLAASDSARNVVTNSIAAMFPRVPVYSAPC